MSIILPALFCGAVAILCPSEAAATSVHKLQESYGNIPLTFEANHGQAAPAIDFQARGVGYNLSLTSTEATFRLAPLSGAKPARGKLEKDPKRSAAAVLRMRVIGGNTKAAVEGRDKLAGKVNYFVGNDPARWRRNVPTFGKVHYSEVYPGIDLVYYGNQKRLEYDFVVAPGSDPRTIALQFDGADDITVEDSTGDLLVRVGGDTIRQYAPFTYQETAHGRRAIDSRYVIGKDGRVGFEVGEYDTSATLVIDPVIFYSTFLGGSGDDTARAIAVDSSGHAYVTGETVSTNFPTGGAVQSANAGNIDVFVTKFNASGSGIVYSTYFGGSANDRGYGIAVDPAGNAYITGEAHSYNFPTANALQPTMAPASNPDAFVTKLDSSGSAIVYSTYLGGNGTDTGRDIAVDPSGNAYVTGGTGSNSFPTVNPVQAANGGNGDAFVTKINAGGSALVYSTYLGGSGPFGETGRAIALDGAGNAYIAGQTTSANFPTVNPVQPANGGGTADAFVTKINAAGSALVYSTYVGGSGNEGGFIDIATDSSGTAYVTGASSSANFPTANAVQPAIAGSTDAFVMKLNPAGSAFIYSTFLGGEFAEVANGIAVDSDGDAYVVGTTASTQFPTTNAVQASASGSNDAFVTKINTDGSALVYSTYLGGKNDDYGFGIALDPSDNPYIAGQTNSPTFPSFSIAGTPFQGAVGGGTDAFVTKIESISPAVRMASQPDLSYTEDFNDIADWRNGFTFPVDARVWRAVPFNDSGTGTIPDGVRTTQSTAVFQTPGTQGGLQRGSLDGNPPGTIVLLATGTPDNTRATAIDLALNFSGVEAGTLSFDWASVNNETGNRNGSLRVYTSTDGKTFSELPAAAVLNFTNNSPTAGSIANVQLPTTFNNNATCLVRFYHYNGTGGTTGSRPKISIDNVVVTAVGAPPPPRQLLNISTRLGVGTGENALIGGFIITGNEPKKVIIRAIGPSLSQQGVNGALENPTLQLYDAAGELIAANDNWRETQQGEIEASTIPPRNDLESAIVRTLPASNYTAIVRGNGDSTGIGLVEVYDLGLAADAKLANISSRGFVDAGDNVMIGGFIVGGSEGSTTRVVVRAIGPSLTGAGVAGALQDPVLRLIDANGAEVRANDDWKSDQQGEIEAIGIQPGDDREATLVANLAAGSYTAIVRGKDSATGVGLVEVYDVP